MLGEVAISSRARSSLGKSDAGLSGVCCPQNSQHPREMLEFQLVVGRPRPQVGGFLPAEREMERAGAAHPWLALPSAT